MTQRARWTKQFLSARPAGFTALVAVLAIAVLFSTADPGPLVPTVRSVAVTTPLVLAQEGPADGSADGSSTSGDACTDGGCGGGGGGADKGGGGGGDTSSVPAEREQQEPSGTDGAKPTTAPGAPAQRADEPERPADGSPQTGSSS